MPALRQYEQYRITWGDVYAWLYSVDRGSVFEVAKFRIPHPSFNGAYRSIGLPKGQKADWRFPPDPSGRGLHVHDIGWAWAAHLDEVHPNASLLGHFLRDVLP
jgi:hypothetical protein